MTELEILKEEVSKLRDMIESQKQNKLLSKSDVVLWFAETFKRWGSRSGKHARIWRTVNLVLSGAGAIPFILGQLEIVPTGHWENIITQIVMYAGLYGAAMNTLNTAKATPEIMPLTTKKSIEEEIKKEETK